MAQNMENIHFPTFFTINFTTMSLLMEICDFRVPLNISDQIHSTLSKVALFFKKMHIVFKNKAQECSTPLNLYIFFYRKSETHCLWYNKLIANLKKNETPFHSI